ncbi:MAG: hypothetical protein IBX64_02700 [Actinobacteria bacterium]|nr:hypothetical protein [Actinomycetota bacterium]
MRKALISALAVVFALAMVDVALAAEPTGYKSDGNPYWTYKDRFDPATKGGKNEGGYAPFEDEDDTRYLSTPHGGFDTASNKCKICHATHRSEGAYFMLRADSQDDACSYCHIGGSAHSNKTVYDLNNNGKQTTNGHTIGASATIPDSSVYQWIESVTLSTTDSDGNIISETIKVRRYSAVRNKMFRITRHHGHNAAGSGRSGYLRIGPLALSCINCHQPHNAKNLIWKPLELENGTQLASGYKLLRLMPSGSVWGSAYNGVAIVNYDEGMREWKPYTGYRGNSVEQAYVNAANVIKVPETNLSAANTGRGHTIYTEFEGIRGGNNPDRDPQTVNQYALSPWCADCHNLNIGYWNDTGAEFGYRSYAHRTHPVPYIGANNGPGQCYSCHRNDLPAEPRGSPCETCHFGPGTYRMTNDNIDGAGTASDFPHSGRSDSVKLLGNFVGYMDADGNRQIKTESITLDSLDGVCLRCHTGVGTNQ